jgi:MoaA/NifB/PqqE/SkfB family radical SAM enzyme
MEMGNGVEYKGKKVVLMACSSCNINCGHCYISYEGDRNPDELVQIARNLKGKYQLNLNGAEILTNSRYLETLQEINQPYFMTNGLLIYQYPKIIDYIKCKGIKSISMSYHFGIQGKISEVKEQMIESNIKLLLDSGLEVRLMITINPENHRLIEYICDKAYELGVRGIKFTNYLMQGKAINLSRSNVLSDEEKAEFFRQLKLVREKYDILKLLIERCGTFGIDPTRETQNFVCHAGTNSVVITPDNNVYPCVFLAKKGNEIGILHENRIIITNPIEHDGTKCLADEICNRNAVLMKSKVNK